MHKIVIILPTYNEGDNIISLIEAIEKQFKKLNNYQCEILVVDDNSPDRTAYIVKNYQKKFPFIKLITGQKKGLGTAYIRGMNYAINEMHADIFFQMDADFSHDPSLIPIFIKKIEEGNDFVIGSRYIPNGSIPKQWGLERKIFSITGNLIVRFGLMILKIKDWTSGYRAIKSEVFKKISVGLDKYTGYTFQVALLHRTVLEGFKIAEIPLKFIDRKYGKSKIIPSEYIKNVILYIFINSSFIKFIIVGTVGFVIQTIIAKTVILLKILPGIAVSIGAEAAIISNYIFNQFWTFSHKRIIGKRRILKKFIQFNTASLGAIAIQGVSVSVGTAIFGHDVWFICMVLSIILLVIPYSYFIYQNVIWKEK